MPVTLFNIASRVFRAAAPSIAPNPQLGPLTDLAGTWVGAGFNVIWLPVFHGYPDFRLKLNATNETLTITKIGGNIPNRGSVQADLNFLGLHYLQQVSDTVTHTASCTSSPVCGSTCRRRQQARIRKSASLPAWQPSHTAMPCWHKAQPFTQLSLLSSSKTRSRAHPLRLKLRPC